MAEDWRVTVTLHDEADADRVLERLHVHKAGQEARRRFGDRVAVSVDDDVIFLYADGEGAAREAASVVVETLASEGSEADFRLEHWHPDAERWEDADVPLPSTPAEQAAEHQQLEREEAAESRASGEAEWELRIEFASHRDASSFADRLAGEGYDHVVRRWRFLVVGADNEDDAKATAERLRGELPAGATIHLEPGSGLAWEFMPANPFAIMGGLGG